LTVPPCGEILPLALWKKIDYTRCGKNSLLFITHLQQVAKMLSALNFDSLKNLTSNKTKFSKNIIQ
jgi:hypothetical protein